MSFMLGSIQHDLKPVSPISFLMHACMHFTHSVHQYGVSRSRTVHVLASLSVLEFSLADGLHRLPSHWWLSIATLRRRVELVAASAYGWLRRCRDLTSAATAALSGDVT